MVEKKATHSTAAHTPLYYNLEGKLKRQVFSTIKADLITNEDGPYLLTDDERARLKEFTAKAIDDASEAAVEFMIEHELIKTRPIHPKEKGK
jgi:hypothetical protein